MKFIKLILLIGFIYSANTINAQAVYEPDILGNGFEMLKIKQVDDYEGGGVFATLVRKKATAESKHAILYVHGFNDYFFQTEYAEACISQGFNFYAVDLRKYGRSYTGSNKFNNVRDLSEYYADLDSALQRMKSEGMEFVLLNGHSTGGLIVSLYANDHQKSNLFDALFLNSPFFDLNANFFMENMASPVVSWLGQWYPDKLVNGDVPTLYTESLYKSKYGEWDFDLSIKPIEIPPVNFGWIRAIKLAQDRVHEGLVIDKPVLVMYSDKSIYEKEWSEIFFTGDAVLDVNDIKKYSSLIKGDVTQIEIKNGIHDLVLSKKPVREHVYAALFDWLKTK